MKKQHTYIYFLILLICKTINVNSQVVTLDERPAFVKSHSERTATKSGLNVFKYTNPITKDTSISMRDYFIIKVGNKWYATGTSMPVWSAHNPGVRLLVSDDLLHWKQEAWLIDGSKLSEDSPYNGRFWAPEIHLIQNKYWLTVNSGKVTTEDPKE